MRATKSLTAQHNIAYVLLPGPALNKWIKKKALRNHSTGISRVQAVSAEITNRVIDYYYFSSGSVRRNTVPGAYRRNEPDVIPSIVLGRLAIDHSCSCAYPPGELGLL